MAESRLPHTAAAPPNVAGVDEAGRGPLAGPVVAAAVMLDPRRPVQGLADSKRLSARARDRLHELIVERAVSCCVAQATAEEIDELNILQATLLAMRRAVLGLRVQPVAVWVDGNRLPVLELPAQAVVGGDGRVDAIAAASILAKVSRDRLCVDLHLQFPQYGFDIHKGYPTPMHLQRLLEHGPCPAHRRSFAPVREAAQARASHAQPCAQERG